MTDAPKIVPLRPAVKAEAVEYARELLAMCEAGQIVEFYWAGVAPDGSTFSRYTGTTDTQRRLASVYRLAHRLNIQMDRDST